MEIVEIKLNQLAEAVKEAKAPPQPPLQSSEPNGSRAAQRKFMAEAPQAPSPSLPSDAQIDRDLENVDKGVSGAWQVLQADLRLLGQNINTYRSSQGFSLADLCGGYGSNGVPLTNALTDLLNNGFVFSPLDLSPRDQWGENDGYCGETCLISDALSHGEYISQAEARRLAGGEMKVGQDSALKLAQALHLKYTSWNQPQSTQQFIAWMEGQLAEGHPVVIGVYMNTSVFGGDSPDDPTYDHIVTVTGIKNGNITFCDNGLYTPDGSTPSYTMTLPLTQFVNTRDNANLDTAPPYSLPEFSPGDEDNNDGLAITGFDSPSNALPVRLFTNINDEPYGSSAPLKLTGCISGLHAGKKYSIKIYNSLTPGAPAETLTFTATGPNYVFPLTELNGVPINTSDEIMVQAFPIT